MTVEPARQRLTEGRGLQGCTAPKVCKRPKLCSECAQARGHVGQRSRCQDNELDHAVEQGPRNRTVCGRHAWRVQGREAVGAHTHWRGELCVAQQSRPGQ